MTNRLPGDAVHAPDIVLLDKAVRLVVSGDGLDTARKCFQSTLVKRLSWGHARKFWLSISTVNAVPLQRINMR